MNNIVSNFEQILSFGRQYGLPVAKKKAILREYLQTKILDLLYQDIDSSGFVFVGGTSLRLLYGLNRFSEDLDFDLNNSESKWIDQMVDKICDQLKKQNIGLDLYRNETKNRIYYEFRFLDLLFELGLSRQIGEKLTIKLDYETYWKKQDRQVKLINRYGYLVRAVSISLDQHLVQKLVAYLERRQTQPRDIYDIVWLKAQGAEIDWQYVNNNGMKKNIVDRVINKFERERSKLKTYQARLAPFLIDESHIDKLDLLSDLFDVKLNKR